ncbi:MAG: chemotaxis protein CheW [Sulfuricurvum sp.]|nr:chemotaxis protein CheW [Sulfuricurvum sp.]
MNLSSENEFDYMMDEDELDLVKLVTSNANDANQYLIFEGSNQEFYAINVAKIEEILVYNEMEVAKNTDGGFIIGTAEIRGKMTPLLIFDAWFGNPILEKNQYELMILASYGGHRIAMIVKKIEDIIVIESKEMQNTSQNNINTTFIANIKIQGTQHLCTIFDSDKMLLDIFREETEETHSALEALSRREISAKTIFFADDSRFIRQMVQKLFQKLGVDSKIFENGLDLIEALKSFPTNEIALIITDIEMPIKSGHEVISAVRGDQRYRDIKLIVHTNMANEQMEDSLIRQGVNRVIGKINIASLESAIEDLIR